MQRLAVPLVIMGLLALACDSSPMHELDVVPIPIDSNPAPIDTIDTIDGYDEAEMIAVVISGELTAPWQLRERVRDDLYAIRSGWIDSVPQVAIRFFPMWVFGQISVKVTGATISAIKDGRYTAWDSLNEIYMFDSIRTHQYIPATHFTMHFEGCQNPLILAEAYALLPGFVYADASTWIGDSPLLYVFPIGNQMIYFFRNAWGDCPAGCIYNTYDIFTTINGSITYHGHFDGWLNVPEPWFARLKEAIELYSGHDYWPTPARILDTDGPI